MKLFFILSFLTIAIANIEQKFDVDVANLDEIFPIPIKENRISTDNEMDYEEEEQYQQPKHKEDRFDWILSKELFKQNQNKNIIVSPFSVKLLMTVLAEAAGENNASLTRKQLKKVLPKKKTLKKARKIFHRNLEGLEEKSDKYTLNIGSKGFMQHIVHASSKLESNLKSFYKFNFEKVNFRESESVAENINNWVKELTNGKIASLVDRESLSNSVILLMNVIYFRGLWKIPFGKTTTKEFEIEKDVKVAKEFVEQVSEYYYLYSKNLSARIVRLPYEGERFSMFVLLPFEVDGLDELVDKLNSKTLRNEIDRMELAEVHVSLPKFRYESSLKLKNVVKAIGISEIFEDSATFPLFNSSTGGLKVSDIIQNSGIVVDEKGSEAFAATEIEMIDKFGGDPREFNANHTFIFYIEDDRTGAKLFSGVVNNPEY